MLIFLWKVYAGPSDLGSTDKVYDNLVFAAEKNPAQWNKNGSYLTMWSTNGIIFGIINIIGISPLLLFRCSLAHNRRQKYWYSLA